MTTHIHNLKEAACRPMLAFGSPAAASALGLRHGLTSLLPYPQAAAAGKGFESFNLKNEGDTKSEYPAPPIAPASLRWETCS